MVNNKIMRPRPRGESPLTRSNAPTQKSAGGVVPNKLRGRGVAAQRMLRAKPSIGLGRSAPDDRTY